MGSAPARARRRRSLRCPRPERCILLRRARSARLHAVLRTAREVERKYERDADAPLDLAEPLAGLPGVAAVDEPAPADLDADLPRPHTALRLAARGVTLRRRTGGTDAGWRLKLPAGVDALARGARRRGLGGRGAGAAGRASRRVRPAGAAGASRAGAHGAQRVGAAQRERSSARDRDRSPSVDHPARSAARDAGLGRGA